MTTIPLLGQTRTGTVHSKVIATVDSALLASVIANCWSKETSYDPEGWSPKNPAWGQCAVTALVVQDYLGGILLYGQVYGNHHYLNQLPDGMRFDLTVVQFGDHCSLTGVKEADRAYVLAFPNTVRRYRKLKARVEAQLNGARK